MESISMSCNEPPCGLDVALTVVGGKWKPMILFHLNSGPKRFGDLRRLVAGISEKVLIHQLRELAAAGVLTRHDHHRVPPMVDYTMTPFGTTLAQALDAAMRLGDRAPCPGGGGHVPARRGHSECDGVWRRSGWPRLPPRPPGNYQPLWKPVAMRQARRRASAPPPRRPKPQQPCAQHRQRHRLRHADRGPV